MCLLELVWISLNTWANKLFYVTPEETKNNLTQFPNERANKTNTFLFRRMFILDFERKYIKYMNMSKKAKRRRSDTAF